MQLFFSNNAYEIKAKRELMTYYHRCCFSPVISTWLKATENGNVSTWSGLTTKAVQKYLGKYMETARGHMQQQCKNVRSTKIKLK